MTPHLRDTIREAYDLVSRWWDASSVMLVGTAGLAAYGYAVEPHDIDFLVAADFVPSEGGSESTPSFAVVRGMTVHVLPVTSERTRFYRPDLAVRLAGNVRVAPLEDIIGLKRQQGRPKDVEFLRGWDAWAKRAMEPVKLPEGRAPLPEDAARIEHGLRFPEDAAWAEHVMQCPTCMNALTGHV